MANIFGTLNPKAKSEEAISNNGAYFVDLTNATESSGTYTIPSADIENGDFTLQVGDLLVDKNSGNLLKVATLTPDITADLVVEASSGGGGGGTHLYQHNINLTYSNGTKEIYVNFTIINNSNSALSFSDIYDYLDSKPNFKYNGNQYTKLYDATGHYINSNTPEYDMVLGMYINTQNTGYIRFPFINLTNGTIGYWAINSATITDTIIAL